MHLFVPKHHLNTAVFNAFHDSLPDPDLGCAIAWPRVMASRWMWLSVARMAFNPCHICLWPMPFQYLAVGCILLHHIYIIIYRERGEKRWTKYIYMCVCIVMYSVHVCYIYIFMRVWIHSRNTFLVLSTFETLFWSRSGIGELRWGHHHPLQGAWHASSYQQWLIGGFIYSTIAMG